MQLGVSSHVIFNNRFMSSDELLQHVGSADIYITSYRQEAQVVSVLLQLPSARARSFRLLTDTRKSFG